MFGPHLDKEESHLEEMICLGYNRTVSTKCNYLWIPADVFESHFLLQIAFSSSLIKKKLNVHKE